MKSLILAIWKWICLKVIANIHWQGLQALFNHGKYWKLTYEDWKELEKHLESGYYIILIRRNCHFTTYLISLGNFIKTGKFGFWSHALMNLEGDVAKKEDFRLVEATAIGTHFSPFDKIFDCDAVCLLRPKGFTEADWNEAMEGCLAQIGKPYDTLFNVYQDNELSCVELDRAALMNACDYEKDFPEFEDMIKKANNLTPEMFYNCSEFEKILEIRR